MTDEQKAPYLKGATGIVWVGPIFDEGGYGSVSRNCLLGLKKINFPVKVIPFGGGDRRDRLNPDLVRALSGMFDTDVGSNPIGIHHNPPDFYPRIKFRGVSKKIGYTIFETDRIPSHWVNICNQMDEIWVPSGFNFMTFSHAGVKDSKLKILPYGVDTEFFSKTNETLEVKGKKGFSFLYTFAFDWRKGFDLLIEAYLTEFSSHDDVSLILKVFKPTYFPGEIDIKNVLFNSAKVSRNDPPHIIILDKYLDMKDMKSLYNTCDLYVSTDRANGWGMPCMEAMSMGKPAATIDWSGSTEFMKSENSLLIKPTGRLVPVHEQLVNSRNFYKDHMWAEVRLDEVRRVLRFAYENRELLKQIGMKGREDMLKNYSLENAAKKTIDLISDTPKKFWRLRKPLAKLAFNEVFLGELYKLKLKLLGPKNA